MHSRLPSEDDTEIQHTYNIMPIHYAHMPANEELEPG